MQEKGRSPPCLWQGGWLDVGHYKDEEGSLALLGMTGVRG
jgi:hypothetical protein